MANPKLVHPFSLSVNGPTSSGKSYLVFSLCRKIKERVAGNVSKIYYFYGQYQDEFADLAGELGDFITFVPALSVEILEKMGTGSLAIFDDLFDEINSSPSFAKAITAYRHHKKISVIFMQNNLFVKGSRAKTIQVNVQYSTLFKLPRDKQQVETFGRQVFGKDSKFFLDAYERATSEKYGYLFVDLKPDTPRELTLSSNVCGEGPRIYFVKPEWAVVKYFDVDDLPPFELENDGRTDVQK